METQVNEMQQPDQWNDLQNKLKAKYPELTEADLAQQENSEQDMLRIVEYKLRKTKAEMEEILGRL
jgi:hypothetical protein